MSSSGPDDPCNSCEVKKWYDWEPEHDLTEYAFFIAGWMEDFNISPDDMSWRDYGIYQIFKHAKSEHERKVIADGRKENS